MRIAIIGGGAWGSALYKAFNTSSKVALVSRKQREGFYQIDLDEALNYPYVILAIAAQSIKEWFESSYKPSKTFLIIASKGIDANSGRFLNEIANEFVDPSNLAFLSGPSFAKEVSQFLPTALTIFSKNQERSKEFAKLFPKFIKPYFSDDVVGGEIAGAYKNVIAIAAGIAEGLKLGNNARAALVSRGLVEIDRFGRYFGGRSDTFLGISGSGDLFLTASSVLSRNFRTGLGLAEGKDIDEILRELGEVAEGVMSAKAIVDIACKHNLYTPIANEVLAIINGKNPKQSVEDMLNR